MVRVADTRIELLRLLVPAGEIVAEVGVHTGEFSRAMVGALEPTLFFGIDAWRFIPGEYERDPMNRQGRPYLDFMAKAEKRLASFPNATLVRATSAQAAQLFADEVFGCIYLDADHTEPGIRGDIERWWPKVRKGGVLAGHDYVERDWIDVMDVVDEFVSREDLDVVFSRESLPSWAIVKP